MKPLMATAAEATDIDPPRLSPECGVVYVAGGLALRSLSCGLGREAPGW